MKKLSKKRMLFFLFKLFFLVGFIYLIYYQSWVMDESDLLERQTSASYRGLIVKKYFLRATHLEIKVGEKTIDIAAVTDSLYFAATVGDSIIKYGNSNCCAIIRNDSLIILPYIIIPKKELSRSKYLQEIMKKDCKLYIDPHKGGTP